MNRRRENVNDRIMNSQKIRIGVFGVGYFKYWEQFPGLYEELMQKQKSFMEKLRGKNAELIDFGMVDSPQKAYRDFKRN
jgi:L-arabinose isomerase